MRILLLGATGLVGRHVWRAFRGRELVATSRLGTEGTLPLDVRDAARLGKVLVDARPDVIVNAAADAWVERCESDPAATRAVNVEPMGVLARHAVVHSCRLVAFSSEYVFDGTGGPYAENHKTRPINEYGRQKVDLEEIARSVPRHLIVRTSGVYGLEPARRNFVLQVLDRLRAGQEMRVPHDQLITPTYAPSLADVVVDLVDREVDGVLNVPGPLILPRAAFAMKVASTFDLPVRLIRPVATSELGLTAQRPARAGLLDGKLRSTLGHATTHPDAGLRALVAEERMTWAALGSGDGDDRPLPSGNDEPSH